uniref:hypothetical protein n=1 Tax=Microbacterium proteolyticum TaxID=1572644 RepID=UPI0024177EB2|nr:hypothetical protein [Microbacterium proteolyticum]
MDRFVDDGSLTIERGNALFVDEDSEPVEESSNQVTPHVLPGAFVDGSDAFEQVKLSTGSLRSSRKTLNRVRELLFDDTLLHRDVVQFLPKLGGGDTTLCGEFD